MFNVTGVLVTKVPLSEIYTTRFWSSANSIKNVHLSYSNLL